jgi:hypothetical protein
MVLLAGFVPALCGVTKTLIHRAFSIITHTKQLPLLVGASLSVARLPLVSSMQSSGGLSV